MSSSGINPNHLTFGDLISLAAALFVSTFIVDMIVFGVIDKRGTKIFHDENGNPAKSLSGKGFLRFILRFLLLSVGITIFFVLARGIPQYNEALATGPLDNKVLFWK